jgi:hypothetical protein
MSLQKALKEAFSTEARFSPGDNVTFYPMECHCAKYKIEKEKLYGTVVAVRFTKAKVFYDVIDDYWGKLFDNVDSCNFT